MFLVNNVFMFIAMSSRGKTGKWPGCSTSDDPTSQNWRPWKHSIEFVLIFPNTRIWHIKYDTHTYVYIY